MCLCLSCLIVIIVTISNKMTERRVYDVIRVNERIFVRSFVKPKNIRLLGFLIFVSPLISTQLRGILT